MDHHCTSYFHQLFILLGPWINNCVGHHNHKYFVLFLFYASIGLSDALIGFLWRLTEVFDNFIEDPVPFVLIMFTFSFVCPVTLGIMMLLSHQIGVLTRNTTTIEDSVRKWQEYDAKKAEQVSNFEKSY